MGAKVRTSPGPDHQPPRVVLTWPLEGAVVAGTQSVYAVASDDSGRAPSVEFWLGDTKIAVDSVPPYQAALAVDSLSPAEYTLSVRAFNAAGNHAEFTSRIWVKTRPPKGSKLWRKACDNDGS